MSSSSSTNSNTSHAPQPEPLPTDNEDEMQTNKLKECIENDTNVEAKHRVALLLGVGSSVIDGFFNRLFSRGAVQELQREKEQANSFEGSHNPLV